MNLVDRVKGFGVGFIAGKLLRGTAEGKYGAAAKWIYWHLRGLKTTIGVVLGVVAGVITVLDHYGVCAVALQHWAWIDCAVWTGAIVRATAGVSAAFLWVGQIDGSLHLEAPDLPLGEAVASFGR